MALTVVGVIAEVFAAQFQIGGSQFVSGNTAILEVAVLSLILVGGANRVLASIRPGLVLSRSERVAIYAMVTTGGAFGAYDCMQFVLPTVLYPFRHAAADANLLRVQEYLPTWLAPRDPSVVDPYYLGQTSFFRAEYIRAWAVPLLTWVLFAGCLSLVMVCGSALLRRRWIEQEHLSFPSLQVPVTIIRGGDTSIGIDGRLAAVGFAIPMALGGLRFAQTVWPAVPSIPLSTDLGAAITSAPWTALQPFPVTLRPLDVGICYFVPLDVGLSAWLFFLVMKFLQVPGLAYGWREWGWGFDSFPYWQQQAIGAWLALFAVLLWTGRRYVARAVFSGLGRRGSAQADRSEVWAARGLVAGVLALLAANWLAGMMLWVAVLFLSVFLILQVVMTRIRAQIGPPVLEVFNVEPAHIVLTLVGPANIHAGSLTLMSLYYWFTQNNRAQPMAHHLDSIRLGQESRTGALAMGATLIGGACLGAATCLLTFLVLGYRYGQAAFPGAGLREFAAQAAFGRLPGLYTSQQGPDVGALPGIAVGGSVVMALAALQRVVLGFPLNPVGYALALSGALLYNWPAFVLVWVVKGGILRYGGLGLYRRLTPVFVGLIVGDIVAQFGYGLASWALAAN